MREAPFRFTFPIEKAEQREDGVYITGLASGPELDSEGERMAPEAIARFAEQINAGGIPLVYRDAHLKDGVLRDLGEVTRAWITPEMHLGVEVRLDTDTNPAADSLFKQIKKGKQFGMSVAGKVLDYVDEFVASVGHVVRTYKNVVLSEISNTTRPSWTPSFGTVLSKAIRDAEESESGVAKGDNLSMDEELQSTQETTEPAAAEKSGAPDLSDVGNWPVVDETGESDVAPAAGVTGTEKASDAADDAQSAAYVAGQIISLLGGEAGEPDADVLRQALALIQSFIASEVAEIGTPEDQQETAAQAMADMGWSASDAAGKDAVEKAGRSISSANAEKLLGIYRNMTATLTELGLIEAPATEAAVEDSEKSVSQDENESTLSKTLAERDSRITALESENVELKKSLGESTARIEELENLPAGENPGLIERAELEDDVRKTLAEMSPQDRLRAGLHARFGR